MLEQYYKEILRKFHKMNNIKEHIELEKELILVAKCLIAEGYTKEHRIPEMILWSCK